MKNEDIVLGTTCHAEHKKFQIPCENKNCRHWMEHADTQNCAIIAANSGDTMTLNEIGQINNVTRMRICQIEKTIIKKIASSSF